MAPAIERQALAKSACTGARLQTARNSAAASFDSPAGRIQSPDTMTNFALLSTLFSLAALFGLISYRVLRLPTSTGTAILSLATATGLIALGPLFPGLRAYSVHAIGGIDFNHIVLHGMLAFLLFAGALHLDLQQLARQKLIVTSLSLLATGLSAVFVALLVRLAFAAVGIHIDTLDALLFGALISPTDPVAVLGMLQRVGAPPSLEAQLAGESLFNDGVGAVLFLTLLKASTGGSLPSPGQFTLLLALDAGGAILLGLALGYVCYRMLWLVDSYRIEIMLTLALAMGGYALADAMGLSAPLEVVAAGLMVNGRARKFAMSERSRKNVDRFWELVDDILNVLLYLLLGFELLVIPLETRYLIAGMLTIPLVLLARWLSVGATIGGLRMLRRPLRGSSLTLLTWGGLRGALAVALALALPHNSDIHRELLLITYVVVVFSVVVQGLTIGPLLRRLRLGGQEVRSA